MSEDDKWERKRAIIALLDIARDALQAAQAISPDEPSDIKESIFTARKAVLNAADYAEGLLSS